MTVPDGTVRQGSVLNFPAMRTSLEARSTSWSQFTPNGITSVQYWGGPTCQITLAGTDPELNVFQLLGSDLWNCNTFTVNVPSGSSVVVNITGASTRMKGFGFFLNGVDRTRIVYNFPQSTLLRLESIGVQGSILAPFAHVDFADGIIHGTIVGASLSGPGQSNHHAHVGCVPAVGTPTPTPTPTSTPTPTATATATPSPTPSPTPGGANLRIDAAYENGSSAQGTTYWVKVVNLDATARTNVKARVFLDLSEIYAAGLTASNVVADEYWDQCGTATISAPVVWNAANKIYYVDATWSNLGANSSCQLKFRLRLSGWQNKWNETNDYSRQGLTTSLQPWPKIQAIHNGVAVWGTAP